MGEKEKNEDIRKKKRTKRRNKKGAHTSINLLTRLSGIRPFLETDKREPLGPIRFPILGQEYPRHASKTFENLAEIVFFGEFGDL